MDANAMELSRLSAEVDGVPLEVESAPVAAAISCDDGGHWYLQIHYTGLLAGMDSVWVRVGAHRHGEGWAHPRDVEMQRFGEEALTARVPLGANAPVEGAELAFFSPGEADGNPLWDNAGHPFGFYAVDARSGEVEAR